MKSTDTHVYFYTGPFSNWDNCHFVERNYLNFHNTEQAFMYHKALFFNDKDIVRDIYSNPDPKTVKALGRNVENFNQKEWDCVKFGFMVYVNYLKFSQNPFYGKILTNTGNKTLVEASPYDKIWGIGLAEDNSLILDEKNWLGQNLLGRALMEVRELIK